MKLERSIEVEVISLDMEHASGLYLDEKITFAEFMDRQAYLEYRLAQALMADFGRSLGGIRYDS